MFTRLKSHSRKSVPELSLWYEFKSKKWRLWLYDNNWPFTWNGRDFSFRGSIHAGAFSKKQLLLVWWGLPLYNWNTEGIRVVRLSGRSIAGLSSKSLRLMELKNVAGRNICHENLNRIMTGLPHCVCEKICHHSQGRVNGFELYRDILSPIV